MGILKVIIEKLSQYNFLTNILPGSVLCIILQYVIGYDIIPEDYYQAGVIFYFVGMVNSRVGSLIVEPFLKYVNILRFAKYDKFIDAERKDSKVSTLSQENNTFRSYTSVMVVVLLAYLYENFLSVYEFVRTNQTVLMVMALLVLFICSYVKQTNYVRKRVEYLTDGK